MNKENEINEFVEEVVYKKINNILNIISESYLKIKYIDEKHITKIEKQELSLHKVKQYKILSELCNKDNNIKIKDLKEPNLNIRLDDILVDEINYLEELQLLEQENKKIIEDRIIYQIILDQQIFMFKLMFFQ